MSPLRKGFETLINRITSGFDQHAPPIHNRGIVEVQQTGGHTACRGERLNMAFDQAEMLAPGIAARMKQQHNAIRHRIQRAQVAAFEAIAIPTGETQVGQRSLPAVLLGKNMVDFVGKEAICLMNEAVFAAVPERGR